MASTTDFGSVGSSSSLDTSTDVSHYLPRKRTGRGCKSLMGLKYVCPGRTHLRPHFFFAMNIDFAQNAMRKAEAEYNNSKTLALFLEGEYHRCFDAVMNSVRFAAGDKKIKEFIDSQSDEQLAIIDLMCCSFFTKGYVSGKLSKK